MTAYFEGAEEFVFIDFETTGRDLLGRNYFDSEVSKNDATQVALAWYEGVHLKSAYSYIKPLEDYFSLKNWSHASPDRKYCINAPKFRDLYPIIKANIENKKLVAHNAPFDTKVMNDSILFNQLEPLSNQWIDTLKLSKEYLPNSGSCFQSCDNNCSGYTLKHLHNYFGFGDFNHHNAVADVFALARIFSIIYKPKTDYTKDWVFV